MSFPPVTGSRHSDLFIGSILRKVNIVDTNRPRRVYGFELNFLKSNRLRQHYSSLLSRTTLCVLLVIVHWTFGAGAARGAGAAVDKPSVFDRSDPRDDGSPWGVATGAEWLADYPRFNPLLQAAGVGWLRGFYEWQTIQPREGIWNWESIDRFVANAKANRLQITGGFSYLARWASADGGTRAFPIKNIQYWRDYVMQVVARYHDNIKYWEVWNEFNGSFADHGTPAIYAQLVQETYRSAKSVDPTANIGMSVANFDVGFLDAAIKAGAADHFDYICIHPYENLASLNDRGELGFLSMAGTLRRMLADNHQRTDIPLWITEMGAGAPVQPDASMDQEQAEALAKAYLLAIASGFQRIFWFEARGPSYNRGNDFGVIRRDWTKRPSFLTLQTLIDALGPQPRYLGWLDLGDGGYGFLYEGRRHNVLAAWSPAGTERRITFSSAIGVMSLTGDRSILGAGDELVLTKTPRLLTEVPTDLVQQARSNGGKPFFGEGADVQVLTCSLQAENNDKGVTQVSLHTTISITTDAGSWRRGDFARPDQEGRYVYFRVDPRFVPYGTKDLQITAVVRRSAVDKPAGTNLQYESKRGYVLATYQDVPAGSDWHEVSWKVSDANFVGQWGWNFRLNALGSLGELDIKEVRVNKIAQ
jgi:hypothetical protein